MAAANGYGKATLVYLQDAHVWRIFAGRSNYPEMIRRWRSVLGEDRIILLSFDGLSGDPEGLLRTVVDRLGLIFDERFFPNVRAKKGSGKPSELPPELYALAKLRMRRIYEDLSELVPEIGRSWFARHYGVLPRKKSFLAGWPRVQS
jgi:hypothetical protein